MRYFLYIADVKINLHLGKVHKFRLKCGQMILVNIVFGHITANLIFIPESAQVSDYELAVTETYHCMSVLFLLICEQLRKKKKCVCQTDVNVTSQNRLDT